MELLGTLILIALFPLSVLCAFKFADLWCRGLDQLLKDLSDAVNGKYKSKYKKGK